MANDLLLDNIRVIDFARSAPGAFCTMMLGDLGADVCKIETPQRGKTVTGSGVSPLPGPEGERIAAFDSLNRNKKSIAIDLGFPEGREIVYKLAAHADVVVEGFRPGVCARLKIDYDTLKKINPGIVYCSITGYGQDGPYRDLPGHDINYVAIAGALNMIGSKGQPPAIPMNLVGDYAGGTLYAVVGILAALVARNATGQGKYVDISMTDGAMALLSRLANDYFREGALPRRGEHRLNGGVPGYNTYETKDGKYLGIGCLEPVFWENLCRAIGCEELISLQFPEGKQKEEVFAKLRQVFLTRTRDEWFKMLKDKNICVAPVYDFDEALTDPQVVHRRLITEVSHPKLGKAKQIALPIKFSGGTRANNLAAPLLGQHTKALMAELDYKEGQIKALRAGGVIQ